MIRQLLWKIIDNIRLETEFSESDSEPEAKKAHIDITLSSSDEADPPTDSEVIYIHNVMGVEL